MAAAQQNDPEGAAEPVGLAQVGAVDGGIARSAPQVAISSSSIFDFRLIRDANPERAPTAMMARLDQGAPVVKSGERSG